MKKVTISLFAFLTVGMVYAQKPQWACSIVKTNDPNSGDFAPKQILFIPDAYPSGGKSNQYTYCLSYTEENLNSKKIPDVKFKLEYCTPIIAEQIVIVESFKPGTITKVEIEDVNGKTKVVYKGKPTMIADEQRLFYIPFTRTSDPIRYVTIESSPGDIPGMNCLDGVALCPTKDPLEIKINLGADLHFISESKPMGPNINTPYKEVIPVVSPAGDVLYIDRKNHPQNIRKSDEPDNIHDDIYYTRKDKNGEWMEARNLGSPLNNWSHNFVNSISPDANTLLLANTYNADGSPKGPGASTTKRIKNQAWTNPEDLNIIGFNNKNKYVSFFMANTNSVLLMSIEDDDSYGEKDIYVSFLQSDKSWSKPLNIGDDINTMMAEYAPVLASDNVTMYFSSEGHYGYGSYDIYVTKRLDDTWKKWSRPVNLGPQLNSWRSNIGFSIPASGKLVYTYGYLNKDTQEEIFVTELGEANSIKPDPVYLVSGRVFDAKTKKPLHADIIYELLPSGSQAGTASSNPDDGGYKIVLPVGNHYGYFAQTPGYIAVHENLDIPEASQYTEYHKDLYLVPIETGQTIALNNVFFEQSKPVLLATSYPELDRMAEILRVNPKLEIRIDGHTDNQGDAKKNMELSQQRVEVVKAYMVNKGINSKRITTKAFGGTKPIASNAKEETRKLNRRVEFTIVKH
jgi:outer membrane protein OmpA-like peptidoglycan-associated protein